MCTLNGIVTLHGNGTGTGTRNGTGTIGNNRFLSLSLSEISVNISTVYSTLSIWSHETHTDLAP